MRKTTKNSKRSKQVLSKTQVKQMIVSRLKTTPLKYVDTQFLANVIDTGVVFTVTLPGQGTQANNRTGDNISLVSMDVIINTFVADTTNVVRILLVQYIGTQTNTLVPLSVLSPGFIPGFAGVNSFVKAYAENQEFHVLFDKQILLNTNSSTASVNVIRSFVPPIKNMGFQLNSFTSTTGALYWVIVTDSAITPHPPVGINTRLWFRDD